MEDIQKNFEEIKKEFRKTCEQLEKLENTANVKKYLALCEKRQLLSSKFEDIFLKVLAEKYRKCDHVLVECNSDYDSYEGRSYHYFGCIKCGLDESVKEDCWCYSKIHREMRKIISENPLNKIKGKKLGVKCDLKTAMNVYSEVKEENPDISEDELLKIVVKEIKKSKKLTYNNEPRSIWDWPL